MPKKAPRNPSEDAADLSTAPLNASLITRILKDRGALGWQEMTRLLGAESGARKRRLRLLLKGLIRHESIGRSGTGAYQVVDGVADEGVLEAGPKGALLFLGHPVVRTRGARHRPGDRVQARLVDGEAQVLKILNHGSGRIIGELVMQGHSRYVESLSPEYKGRISLDEVPNEGANGDTVAVQINGEDRQGLRGSVVALVASAGLASQAAETLLESHGVPVIWPEGVEAAAAALPEIVQPGRYRNRVSLVDVPLVTIDGETARDFDDAVYAEPRGRGFRVLVAIADVAHYVKSGAALDLCARERGNSVYLPDRVIPMLPEALSNGLCSLRPEEHRLAMVCDMKVSAAGKITGFEFYEAIIRSWQRLTYTQVGAFLAGAELAAPDPVCESLKTLQRVYQSFRGARDVRGGLDFESREAVIKLEQNRVVGIQPVIRNDAHRLIEEAMIAANVCAAELLENAGYDALYRIHEPPTEDKLIQMRQALAFAGLNVPRGDLGPKHLQKALTLLADRPNRWVFESLIMRSMSQACYSPENRGHFGLALTHYAHFTSPIRRYADLIVHRALKLALKEKPRQVGTPDWLADTGVHISATERRADEVSWGVDAWLKCEFMRNRIGEQFTGIVAGVAEFGLFVELPGYYVQGLVHISELGADYFNFRAESMSLVGSRSGRRFGLGDELRVQLMEVQPARGRLVLEMVSPSGGGSARGRSGGKAKGKSQERSGKGRASTRSSKGKSRSRRGDG